MLALTRSFRRVFALAGLSLAAVAADAASAAAQPEKLFNGEVANYRLTTAGMQKFMQATQNLDALEDDAIDMEDRFENMDDDDIDIGRIAAAFDGEPLIRNAINSAGLTSREYLTFMFSMIQTMLAAAMLEIGGENALAEMEDSVLKQNVQFFREHQAEFEALGKVGEDDDG